MTQTYGTLQNDAGFPVSVRVVRRGVSTPSASGFVTARTLRADVSRQSNQPQTRVWRLTFGPLGFSSLLAAFDSAKGGALPLSWTPPPPDEAAAIPVQFVDGTLIVRRAAVPELFEAEVEIEEVA